MNKILALDERLSFKLRIAEKPGWLRTVAAILAHSGDSWFWLLGLGLLWLFGSAAWKSLALILLAGILITAVLVMLINMVLALVVLPLLVWFVKPRFVGRKDLLVGEGVDLSAYVLADSALAGAK